METMEESNENPNGNSQETKLKMERKLKWYQNDIIYIYSKSRKKRG